MDPAARLSVNTDARNGVAYMSLDGEIDMSTVTVLESHLAPFESDGVSTIMLDLHEVKFTDSAGIHALVDAKDRVSVSGRQFMMVRSTPTVRRVFDLTGNLDLLDDGDGADVVGHFIGSDGHIEGQATPVDGHA